MFLELLVAVVGPPGVGKSTVTGGLADRFGVQVFRLREFAQEFRLRVTVDKGLFNTRDPLGWLPEETVFLLLQAALIHGQFPARDMVVLENFPGSLTQLLLLAATTKQLEVPLNIVELTAADHLLTARVRTRRVCPTCEHDPAGDPHKPARPAADSDRCNKCGGGLAPRRSDEPQRFAARLARFRRRIPAIRRAAAVLHVPYHTVDTTCDARACLHRVTEALTTGTASTHLLAFKREHI